MPDSEPVRELIELTEELEKHLKLLRDYAASPGDLWLARGELTKSNSMIAEAGKLLDSIEGSEADR